MSQSLVGTPAVRISGLTKTFGDAVAVHPTDLEIRRGEFFSILGPSGCGKTTLMRMITGFETPSGGSVELDGTVVDSVPTRDRDLNMLFQSYALFPHLTVFENIAFELRVRKTARGEIDSRVRDALALVRMEAFASRKPAELSGGQRQRVALARAVVGRPAVVLLDEPLGALDQKLRKEMQFELKRMQREVGITFIYVTHDQEEALTMSDRIAVMSAGRVQQIADPATIYERPATRFVASFIGSCNLIPVGVEGGRAVSYAGLLPHRPTDLADGTSAVLAVRPERVTLSTTQAPGALRATIAERIYLGDGWQVLLDVGDTRILASVPSGEAAAELTGIADGGEVFVSWSADAGTLLVNDQAVAA